VDVALVAFLAAGLARGIAGTILPLLGPVGGILLGFKECSTGAGAASAEATSGFVAIGGRGAAAEAADGAEVWIAGGFDAIDVGGGALSEPGAGLVASAPREAMGGSASSDFDERFIDDSSS